MCCPLSGWHGGQNVAQSTVSPWALRHQQLLHRVQVRFGQHVARAWVPTFRSSIDPLHSSTTTQPSIRLALFRRPPNASLVAMAGRQENHHSLGGDRAESQALIAPSDYRDGTRADRPAQAPPDDISNLSDREIWRHFETARDSAIFHCGRYLQNLKFWRRLQREEPSVRLEVGKCKHPYPNRRTKSKLIG